MVSGLAYGSIEMSRLSEPHNPAAPAEAAAEVETENR